jgi:dihydrodipicolinate synthase/N-acetylneuraminate lyase
LKVTVAIACHLTQDLKANKKKSFFNLVNGTTGEGIHSLTVDERLELTESWMKQKEKIPHIFVQVGGTNFTEAKILVTYRHRNKPLKTVTFYYATI